MTGQHSIGKQTATFPLLAAVTLASVIFGDYAQDIGRWIVCWDGGGCSDTSKRGAIMLGAFVGTLVAMLSAIQAARIGKQSIRETRLVIVGALAGTLLALLKASEDEKLGYPVFDKDMLQALFIYLATATVFLTPLLFPGAVGRDREQSLRLISVMVLALLIAASLGALQQLAAEYFWTGENDRSSSRKFIIAPVATVMGTAIFGRAMLFPWFSEDGPDWRWLLNWLGYGMLMTLAYILIVYEVRHGAGWMADAPSYLRIRVALSVLLITPLVFFAFVPLGLPKRPWVGVLFLSLCAAPFAGMAAAHVADVRIASGHIAPQDRHVLVIVHMLSPVISGIAICLVSPVHSWISERFAKPSG